MAGASRRPLVAQQLHQADDERVGQLSQGRSVLPVRDSDGAGEGPP